MSKQNKKKKNTIKERERRKGKINTADDKEKKYVSSMGDYMKVRIKADKLGIKICAVMVILTLVILALITH